MSQLTRRHTQSTRTTGTAPLVRWTLTRDGRTVTCQVADRDDARFEVAIVPHWDVGLSVVEETATPVEALQRHAEIAGMLREAGWVVTGRSVSTPAGARAGAA